ncbi:hypothetical protein [Pannonibacter tanglangensis]|uniref:Uncharacterized protein n=1 Tax=Pannonibacter tanglangensis TaxID=2750084 RepID=A0ABW9ZBP4_9HYPH|nr:hypothetical protein [Pannonibacter sp. XCT-34]NBN62066.1 hypothetical protein [Pannonibacter sp. XCT-34]
MRPVTCTTLALWYALASERRGRDAHHRHWRFAIAAAPDGDRAAQAQIVAAQVLGEMRKRRPITEEQRRFIALLALLARRTLTPHVPFHRTPFGRGNAFLRMFEDHRLYKDAAPAPLRALGHLAAWLTQGDEHALTELVDETRHVARGEPIAARDLGWLADQVLRVEGPGPVALAHIGAAAVQWRENYDELRGEA